MRALSEAVLRFRNERDWAQFHTLRNLIVSLNLEAGELLELTQWQSDAEVEALADPQTDARKREALADECADVLLYLLLIADRAGIDLDAAARAKLRKNAAKYPVELSRGSRRKYTEIRAAIAAGAAEGPAGNGGCDGDERSSTRPAPATRSAAASDAN
ncbi:nucleotide pyrophosphohydrolase [Rhodocyclus tenuis]|uniref:NTP pyrophosphatase (Non-canonical NTP hydrolase) n=1 Tax=Rhodocyclus tenuis TaxID=1066 RepID=A0A840GEM0_RHOTE|nr:nucleotide pyrophosphohydrolase [Rhodocyclus tenuis]MBB4247002.1 NTP pyrophosphatase (non-canonical NTP hydrolase) [Rhodocyclus tenuis]